MDINQGSDALIIIDMQNDFAHKDGSLYVKDGHKIIEPIIKLTDKFNNIFFTVDYHPDGHKSFASSHNKKPFDVIEMYGYQQVLWPDHCVQRAWGSYIVDELYPYTTDARQIIRKGMNPLVDSYSAFRENFGVDGNRATTGFGAMLHALGMKRLFFVGLARDYCVKFSAEDAVLEGFEAFVLDTLTKSVDPSPEAVAKTTAELQSFDVSIVDFLDMYGVG